MIETSCWKQLVQVNPSWNMACMSQHHCAQWQDSAHEMHTRLGFKQSSCSSVWACHACCLSHACFPHSCASEMQSLGMGRALSGANLSAQAAQKVREVKESVAVRHRAYSAVRATFRAWRWWVDVVFALPSGEGEAYHLSVCILYCLCIVLLAFGCVMRHRANAPLSSSSIR
jgi:hypothetical protein